MSHTAFASSVGGIDTGAHSAQFTDINSNTSTINFGVFTNQPSANISISDDGIRGYAWSETSGWIIMSCLDTASGCSNANGNFNVAVARDGTLSGYAWGQDAGWINFGPFTNSSAPQVKIDADGVFGGTSGTAGYAWSERYGWVKFDCNSTDTCVKTTYTPRSYRSSSTVIGGMPPITTAQQEAPIMPPPATQQQPAPATHAVPPAQTHTQSPHTQPASSSPQDMPIAVPSESPNSFPNVQPPANSFVPPSSFKNITEPKPASLSNDFATLHIHLQKAIHAIGDALHIQLSKGSGTLWLIAIPIVALFCFFL